MANTNVNLLLNPQGAKTNPSLRADYFSRKTYNLNYKNSGSFNNVFDRITTQPARQSASEPSAPNRVSDYSRPTERSSSNPSTASKPDNSPDEFEDINELDEEVEDEAPSASNVPVEAPIMFTMSTESLLAVREVPSTEEPVMMTVLPQESNAGNQSMLNMLAGNTWRAMQPSSAATPEALPTDVPLTSTAPILETEQLQPLNLEPQSIIAPRGAQPLNVENAPVEPNQLMSIATTVEPIAQPIEQPSVESAVELPVDNAPTIKPQSNVAQPLSNIPNQASTVEAQPIVAQPDATSQTQVVSNDATLSNVVDAAKNSQPKTIADALAPTEPALDNVEMPALEQPTSNAAPTVDRQAPTLNAPTNQPRPIDPQQPVQTQQSIETAPMTNLEPQSITRPSTVETQPTAQPTTNIEAQPLNQPTANVEVQPLNQPTTDVKAQPLNQPTANVEAQPLNQPTTNVAPQLSTAQPSPTQQVFDEGNAAPRGADEIAQPTQPTVDEQANVNRAADVEPVHRRYHGRAAQQAANAESPWANRPAPLYQLAQQQASSANPSISNTINQPSTAAPSIPSEINQSTAAPSIPTSTAQPSAAPSIPTAINQPSTATPSIPSTVNQPSTAPSIPTEINQSTATPSIPSTVNQPTSAPSIPTAVDQPSSAPSIRNTINQPSTGRAATANETAVNQPTSAPSSPNTVDQPSTAPSIPTSTVQPTSAPSSPNTVDQPSTAPSIPNTINQPSTGRAATANETAVAQPTAAPSIPNTINQPTAAPSIPTEINQPSTAAPSIPTEINQSTAAPSIPTAVDQPSATPSIQPAVNQPTAAPSIPTEINQPTAGRAATANETAINQPSAPTLNNAPAQSTAAAQNVSAQPLQTTAAAQNILAAAPRSSAATPISNDNPTAAQAQPSANQNNAAAPVLTASAVQSIAATAPENAAYSSVDRQAAQPSAPSITNNAAPQSSVNNQPSAAPSTTNNAAAPINQPTAVPFAINLASAQVGAPAQNVLQQSTATQMSAPMFEGQAAAQLPGESFTQNFGAPVNNLNTPQPAAQAQPSAPNNAFAQQLRDDFNIAGQIVENARMIRTAQNTEMIIHLKPEHLGELTLRVSVTAEGTVNASFHSDNAAVRAIIENSLVNLKQELANQGLKVDNVEVYAGLADGGSLMNGKGRQAWQQNRRNAQRVERVRGGNRNDGGAQSTAPTAAQSVDIAQPVENVASDGGVDYKV